MDLLARHGEKQKITLSSFPHFSQKIPMYCDPRNVGAVVVIPFLVDFIKISISYNYVTTECICMIFDDNIYGYHICDNRQFIL